MKALIQDVKENMIDKLNDGIGANHASDLHHYLCNEDYFIIGRFQAKEWLGEHVFDAIEKIREYEQDNFGEVDTDFSEPEKVANMLAYIMGEEILQKSETLDEKWDEILTEDDLLIIAEEIA